MNWKAILHSLAAAAIGGSATAVTNYMMDPLHADLHHIGPVAVAGAILGVAMLLRQSPLTPDTPSEPKQNVANFPETR